jgi:hypothetical protein
MANTTKSRATTNTVAEESGIDSVIDGIENTDNTDATSGVGIITENGRPTGVKPIGNFEATPIGYFEDMQPIFDVEITYQTTFVGLQGDKKIYRHVNK